MANKRSVERPGPEGTRAAFRNDAIFVNYDLTVQEKAQCKSWVIDCVEFVDVLDKCVEEGYTISVKFDAYSESFASFLKPTVAGSDNAGLILAGRGSTPAKAIKQALYKHYVIFNCSWPRFKRENRLDDLDD